MNNGKNHPVGCACSFCNASRERDEPDILLTDLDARLNIVATHGQKTLDALEIIVENCGRAGEIVARGRGKFDSDWSTRYAADMVLVRIGEATGRLSPSFRSAFPGSNWRAISDLRNRVAHSADPGEANADVLWESLAKSAPALREYIVNEVFGE